MPEQLAADPALAQPGIQRALSALTGNNRFRRRWSCQGSVGVSAELTVQLVVEYWAIEPRPHGRPRGCRVGSAGQ